MPPNSFSNTDEAVKAMLFAFRNEADKTLPQLTPEELKERRDELAAITALLAAEQSHKNTLKIVEFSKSTTQRVEEIMVDDPFGN